MSEIIEIEDFSSPLLDPYARFSEAVLLNRDNPRDGMFIAESPKVIERALDAGYEPVSFLLERRHIEGEAAGILARCPSVPVMTADMDVLTSITGFRLTRGALCLMRRREIPSDFELCSVSSRIAVLENVMNPTNVGAIIRSAAALGMDAVLLTGGCSDPLYRRAIRVSMGTVFQIPWAFTDEKTVGGMLHSLGYMTAAMALCDDSVPLGSFTNKSKSKIAVFLGTEGEGLASSTIENCDVTLKIPMRYGVDSLNVSAAAAVVFWHLLNN